MQAAAGCLSPLCRERAIEHEDKPWVATEDDLHQSVRKCAVFLCKLSIFSRLTMEIDNPVDMPLYNAHAVVHVDNLYLAYGGGHSF